MHADRQKDRKIDRKKERRIERKKERKIERRKEGEIWQIDRLGVENERIHA